MAFHPVLGLAGGGAAVVAGAQLKGLGKGVAAAVSRGE